MIEIYANKMSFNTTKVLYTAEAAEIDYKYTDLDFQKGEHKSPENLKRNPFGKIPNLVHEGKSLFESGAMCKYIASVANSDLYPINNHYYRCLVDQWMDFASIHIGRWCSTVLFEKVFKEKYGMGSVDTAKVEEATKFFNQQAVVLDQHLSTNKYFTGQDITVADIFMYSYLETAPLCGLNLEEHKNLYTWKIAIDDRPFVAKVKEKHFS